MSFRQNAFNIEYNESQLTSGTFTNEVGLILELLCVEDGTLTITRRADSSTKVINIIAGMAVTIGNSISQVSITTGTFHKA